MGFIHVVGTEFAGSNQLSFSEHTNFGGADLLLGSELTFELFLGLDNNQQRLDSL